MMFSPFSAVFNCRIMNDFENVEWIQCPIHNYGNENPVAHVCNLKFKKNVHIKQTSSMPSQWTLHIID